MSTLPNFDNKKIRNHAALSFHCRNAREKSLTKMCSERLRTTGARWPEVMWHCLRSRWLSADCPNHKTVNLHTVIYNS